MVVGAVSSRTQLAVIGAGPGGYVAALRAADAGLDVTLIERRQLGGTCLNVGCIPSKALIELANVRHDALSAIDVGLDAAVGVRAERISAHLAETSLKLRGGVESLLRSAGVDVVVGDANFARYDRLSIAQDDAVAHLEFDNVIVATGSRPILLDAFPLGERIVTSTGALALTQVPKTMVVIGGGYIGIELGTAWAKLGTRVTIVEATDTILPGMAEVLRTPVERRLNALGINVLTSTRAMRPTPAGLITNDEVEVAGDVIVVAVGRRPNSDQAGLDVAGVAIDPRGHIVVDEQLRAASGVFAIGDLVTGPALAHKASAEAEIAVEAILGKAVAFQPAAIPAVVFSDPEILTVGEPIAGAEERGLTVHRFPHSASARAMTHRDPSGATYVITDVMQTVVGIHAVGPHVSELAGEAALAVEMAATIEDLSLTIHAHPTMSETIAEATWLARGMPLHIRR